jgi:transposase
VQPDFCRAGAQGGQIRLAYDRRPPPEGPSEGPSDGGQLAQKGAVPRRAPTGGLNANRQAVGDGQGRPLILRRSAGQMSDDKGPALLLDALPRAKAMRGDKASGTRASVTRAAGTRAAGTGAMTPTGSALPGSTAAFVSCIAAKANRKIPIVPDQAVYRQRHKIANMFGKRNDWRRIYTSYDRGAPTFFSA